MSTCIFHLKIYSVRSYFWFARLLHFTCASINLRRKKIDLFYVEVCFFFPKMALQIFGSLSFVSKRESERERERKKFLKKYKRHFDLLIFFHFFLSDA